MKKILAPTFRLAIPVLLAANLASLQARTAYAETNEGNKHLGVASLSVASTVATGSDQQEVGAVSVQAKGTDFILKNPKGTELQVTREWDETLRLGGSYGRNNEIPFDQYGFDMRLQLAKRIGLKFGKSACGAHISTGYTFDLQGMGNSGYLAKLPYFAKADGSAGLLCTDGKTFTLLLEPTAGFGSDARTGASLNLGARAKILLGDKVAVVGEVIEQLDTHANNKDGTPLRKGTQISGSVQLNLGSDVVLGAEVSKTDAPGRTPASSLDSTVITTNVGVAF